MFNKIVWKKNFKNPEAVNSHEFFKMFNQWIPNSPEVFVDVADYDHVEDGPKVILVGHYVDYILDHCDRQLGFAYNRKRWAETAAAKLSSSYKEFQTRSKQMLSEQTNLALDDSTLILIENDRAALPNNAASFAKVQPELIKFADETFGAGKYELTHLANPKQRFSVQIKLKSL